MTEIKHRKRYEQIHEAAFIYLLCGEDFDLWQRMMDEAREMALKHRRLVHTIVDEDGYIAEEFYEWDDEEPSYYY